MTDEWAELDAIAELTGQERDRAVSDFLAANDVVVRRVADSLVRRYSLPLAMTEDVVQEVRLVVFSLVRDPALRRRGRSLPSWRSAIHLLSQDVVRAHVESSAVTGSTGMSSVVRRRRALMRFRNEWVRRHGREPGNAELVADFNADMLSRRANAGRQGMLASESDLLPVAAVDVDTVDVAARDDVDGECPLVPVEARSLIESGLRAAADAGELLARVAVVYYGSALSDPPFIAPVAVVARECGLTRDRARRLMRDVDDIMRDVAEREFGISRP